MKYELDIRRTESFDVAVIGGGTSGVFAAISAARLGAKTLLVEKNSRLGGTVTSAGVNFPGLFHAWGKQIIAGPCWEAIERVVDLSGATLPNITYKPERHWMEQIRVNSFTYIKVINDMCREAGVTVMTDTILSYANEQNNSVKLLLADKAGLVEIIASVAIDSTGDGNLLAMLSYPLVRSEVQQPATLDNHISGYDVSNIDMKMLEKAWSASSLSNNVTFDRLVYFLKTNKIDTHVISDKADTPHGKASLEVRAIDSLFDYVSLLRTVKGLENISVDRIAETVGVRESCRAVGEYIVTAEEYVKGVHYPDSVSYAFYPVDLHVEKGIQKTYLSDDVVPEIPYRALVPKGSKRILLAGRMISSDTYANSALRVEAPCMSMGQIAGVAASLAVKHSCNVNEVDLAALKESLKSIGAIVP